MKDKTLSFSILWENLTKSEKIEAVVSFVESKSGHVGKLFKSLSKAYKFREAFVKGWSSSKVAEFALRPRFKGVGKLDYFSADFRTTTTTKQCTHP